MQFHLNGCQPANPEISPDRARRAAGSPLPATTDVLIVGCGSAGLTLAAQMAAFDDMITLKWL